MLKNNIRETLERFDRWWAREVDMVMVVADVRRPAPAFSDILEYIDIPNTHIRFMEYLHEGAFHGDAIPDLSSYLGPGSLSTFIGSEPVYTENTIWFKEGCTTSGELLENCIGFQEGDKEDFPWYRWSLDAASYYKQESDDEYMVSMPDLQQNLDIAAAVMGADRLFMEMMDNPSAVMDMLDALHEVWKKAFMAHSDIISHEGYSAYTHYNIAGRGLTSVLQSDISCMMSPGMFREFEVPYLRKQCSIIDNVIYHLDGPGAIRHIDALLEIEEINAIQWVPGAGNHGNAHDSWYGLYDRIVGNGKGLYVFLRPDEIDSFIKRYKNSRILIRTLADSEEHQRQLVDKYTR